MLRKNKSRGFTLVELLVVIGIIALLISILLPALGKAKAAAKATKCSANIHSLMNALNLYANDYRGWLPKSRGNTSTPPKTHERLAPPDLTQEYSWTWTLYRLKYVNPNQSFLCPKGFVRTRVAPGDDPATSYKYHNFEGYLPNWDIKKLSSEGDNESNRSCYALRWGNYYPVTDPTITVTPGVTNTEKYTEFYFSRLSDLRPASDMFVITEVLSNSTILRHDYAHADYSHPVYLRHGSKQQPVANTGYADGSVRPTGKDYFEAKGTTTPYSTKVWPGGQHTTPVTTAKFNF